MLLDTGWQARSVVSAAEGRFYVLTVLANESVQHLRVINALPMETRLRDIPGITPLASVKIMIRLRLAFGAKFPEQAFALPETLGDLLQVITPRDAGTPH